MKYKFFSFHSHHMFIHCCMTSTAEESLIPHLIRDPRKHILKKQSPTSSGSDLFCLGKIIIDFTFGIVQWSLDLCLFARRQPAFQFNYLNGKRPENQNFFLTHQVKNANYDSLTAVKENQSHLCILSMIQIQSIRAPGLFRSIIKHGSLACVYFMDIPSGYTHNLSWQQAIQSFYQLGD